MEHDELIDSLVKMAEPEDNLMQALIQNMRKRRELFRTFLVGKDMQGDSSKPMTATEVRFRSLQ